ncbi:hypothetical protein KFL_009660025 [Klebsormidium nitens]|uniref:Uncharacterized protein n=1 Tax=Klebsormidium nitens TaxID=105231 RepID=A0A1Y1IN01_KLENI|nr:hypothetical protein KFL_009660025 [Klebsormidium nitens]|eukprot:GAQ92285.1 hypothetical protein KFL_009660025 [Klebsormidium nitens]
MYSPSVEAGVNFDEAWFHSKYLYMCKKSTTARAVWQASLRVRQTKSPVVHCFVQSGISVRLDGARVVPLAHAEGLESAAASPTQSELDQDAEDDVSPEAQSDDDDRERLDEQVASGVPLEVPRRAKLAATNRHGSRCKKGKGKGGQPGLFPPPLRVTTAETLQFLQACSLRTTVAWRRVPSRFESGRGTVRLVEDGPLFRTLGHTEAERRNSDAGLLQEFQMQVAKAGHVVNVEPYIEPAQKVRRSGGLTQEAYDVIGARTLGFAEYKELASLRNVGRDRGTQRVDVTAGLASTPLD